jgi:2-oxoacid:acceptor oxidoreductase gamma subunit (pyruvate/2-ketoisovalerate family)
MDPVLEIRLVGRGGQGVVTAGELLGTAALREGRWAQSLPTFGPERRGALSTATLRIGDEEILLKCAAATPEVVLVLDPTIWHHANVLGGVDEGVTLVFNTTEPPEEIHDALQEKRFGYGAGVDRYRLFTLDATGIAMEALGRPVTNTAMMGAFVGATRMLDMASVEAVLDERFGDKGAANVAAARAAREGLSELGG